MPEPSLVQEYITSLTSVLNQLDIDQINAFIELLAQALDEGRKVFIFGNGGSGATASHIACDLNKGVSFGKSKRFRVICLNDNMPMLTAYANDVAFSDIFVEPLKNFLEKEDVVVGISGSGNSENVIRAILYANEKGAKTVGLCGYSGGRLKTAAQCVVHVNVEDMQKSEDIHHMIGHIAMQALIRTQPALA